jgi:dienelactone hydrolase
MSLRIRYWDRALELTGVLVPPEWSSAPRPGILVIHGGAGLDAHAERRAEHFAHRGHAAFACDMYGDGVAGDRRRIMSAIAELRVDRVRLRDRAQAGIDVLREHPSVDGRIVAVGFCFGGMVALELARSGADIGGTICVHGSLATAIPALPGSIKTRVLVCHGARDPYSPSAHVAAFIEEMNHAGSDWQLEMYGGAMHGFTHEDAAGQTLGVLYDARATARASAAIHAFIDEI